MAEAAFRGAKKAAELIDMTAHKGAHPRMGALDVCPFIPVADVTMAECADLARAVGRRIGDELQIPVYFYEHAAASEERRSLANIRAGEYEGLADKLASPAWAPDAGPARFNARSGGTVVGAREFLLAYNVNLNTLDRRLANEIALNIREGGRAKRDAKGEILRDAEGASIKVPGRLKAVRAIGWYIEQYRQAQVSINLLDYTATPLHVVFETAREEAEKLGLIVTGSELVGLDAARRRCSTRAGTSFASRASRPACRSANSSRSPSGRWAWTRWRRSTRRRRSSSTTSLRRPR